MAGQVIAVGGGKGGVGYNELDLFNAAGFKVVVMTPQLTSLHNGYGFLKSSIHRMLQRLLGPELAEYVRSAGPGNGKIGVGSYRGMPSRAIRSPARIRLSQEAPLVHDVLGSQVCGPTVRPLCELLDERDRDGSQPLILFDKAAEFEDVHQRQFWIEQKDVGRHLSCRLQRFVISLGGNDQKTVLRKPPEHLDVVRARGIPGIGEHNWF